MMRVLVTNDDGYQSEGLRQLALVAITAGCDVIVAAPFEDRSGASASLLAVRTDGHVVTKQRVVDGLPDVEVYSMEASPGYIVLMAAEGRFGAPPDFVLSGCNLGPNTGNAVLHSGTVGAALTASTHGIRAMAVSIDVGPSPHFTTMRAVAEGCFAWLADAKPRTVLNVNVPNIPPSELRGVARARLASFGSVQTRVKEVGEGGVRVNLQERDEEPGTDMALLASGWATYTPLIAPCEARAETGDLDERMERLFPVAVG